MTRSYLWRVATRFIPLWVAAAAVTAAVLFLPPVAGTDDDAALPSPITVATEVAQAPRADEPASLAVAGLRPAADVRRGVSSPMSPPPPSTLPPSVPQPAGTNDISAVTEVSVAYAVWASRTGGTPVSDSGVPDGSLPVGQRGGVLDKATFVRLEGSGTVLTLSENPAGRRSTVGEAAVEACQITERAWDGSEGMSLADAPSWDPNACAVATMSPTGTWTFDLAAFERPGDDRGFALVPVAETIDFQVTFALDD